MYVIGTAGHVDHGKSTLITALTGIDPDRLQEEKDRGLTIDLGFAWLTLPSGREVSIIDVPGHERFIKNMLAGAGGIDLALLVVAADESVMPQTSEHLAILDLLGVKRALTVITKSDLADEEMLGLVELEVEERVKGTSLEGSPVLAVSATTGQGLDKLTVAIDAALDDTEPRRDVGRPRLAIDRSFSIAGFGTVVTGTLIDGAFQVGQEVALVLSGKRSRIRGLQTHRRKLDEATPGSRVAVNLSGISPHEIHRGEVLATPGWLRPTQAVDARLTLLAPIRSGLADAARPLRHNLPVTFHAHTMETPAKVRLLDRDQLDPGDEGWVQLRLEHPVALVRGDHFVVRSPDATLGGGVVVDLHARRHRRRHEPTLERLRVLAQGSPTAQLLQALEADEPADVASVAKRANLSSEESLLLAATAVQEGVLVALGSGSLSSSTLLYTTAGWARLSGRAQQLLAAFHQQQPLRNGMPREELRNRLSLKAQTFSLALQRLTEDGALTDETGVVRLPEHSIALSPKQREQMEAFVRALKAEPFSPSAPTLDPALTDLLADEGRVVKAADGVVFAADAYGRMVERVTAHLHKQGTITVAEVRDMFQTSRKYALALLEHLDDLYVTRRIGDERVLLQR
jgi:selenocysteine-specific elongation factor